jgi:DNA topoisomerase-2
MIRHFPMIDGTFDYLLNIRTFQYTQEAVEDLMRQAALAQEELQTITQMTHAQMWQMDIKKL